MSNSKLSSVGIDLGTWRCSAGVVKDGEVEIIQHENGDCDLPAVVAFTESGRIIGNDAINQAVMNTENTLYGVKKFFGMQHQDANIKIGHLNLPFRIEKHPENKWKFKFIVRNKGSQLELLPQQISAMILAKVKHMTEVSVGNEVQTAVITVPPTFNSLQRVATIEAGRIAGFKNVRLLNEPTAVAVAYFHENEITKARTICIVDSGAGFTTVTIAVVDNKGVSVKASQSEDWGGMDFDNDLLEHVKREHPMRADGNAQKKIEKLRWECKRAKENLSCGDVSGVSLDVLHDKCLQLKKEDLRNETVTAKLRRLFEATLSKYNWKFWDRGVDEALILGSSTKLTLFKETLNSVFKDVKVTFVADNKQMIARGAALYAANLQRDYAVREVQVKDILNRRVYSEYDSLMLMRIQGFEVCKSGVPFPVQMPLRLYDNSYWFYEQSPGGRPSAEICNLDVQRLPISFYTNIVFDVDDNGIIAIDKTHHERNVVNVHYNYLGNDIQSLTAIEESLLSDEATDECNLEEFSNLEEVCFELKNEIQHLQFDDKNNLLKELDDILNWLQDNPNATKEEIQQKRDNFEVTKCKITSINQKETWSKDYKTLLHPSGGSSVSSSLDNSPRHARGKYQSTPSKISQSSCSNVSPLPNNTSVPYNLSVTDVTEFSESSDYLEERNNSHDKNGTSFMTLVSSVTGYVYSLAGASRSFQAVKVPVPLDEEHRRLVRQHYTKQVPRDTRSGVTIGIDLGSSKCCAAVVREGKVQIIESSQGEKTMPSYIAFTETERQFGQVAKDRVTMNPQNTVFGNKKLLGHFVPAKDSDVIDRLREEYSPELMVDESKLSFGISFQNQKFRLTAEQVSAMFLKKMKQMAEEFCGCEVTGAVVAVPSYFNSDQRQAVLDAGDIAGLDILGLINDTTATALTYLDNNKTAKKQTVMIFDVGGGGMSVAVVEIDQHSLRVKGTNGTSELGGFHIDQVLVQHFLQDVQSKYGSHVALNNRKLIEKLRKMSEEMKIALTKIHQSKILIDGLVDNENYEAILSRREFESKLQQFVQPKVQDVFKYLLGTSGTEMGAIEQFVLVGGTTRIQCLQSVVKGLLGVKYFNRTVNADESVAHGAALQAAYISGNNSLPKVDVEELVLNPLVNDSKWIKVPRTGEHKMFCNEDETKTFFIDHNGIILGEDQLNNKLNKCHFINKMKSNFRDIEDRHNDIMRLHNKIAEFEDFCLEQKNVILKMDISDYCLDKRRRHLVKNIDETCDWINSSIIVKEEDIDRKKRKLEEYFQRYIEIIRNNEDKTTCVDKDAGAHFYSKNLEGKKVEAKTACLETTSPESKLAEDESVRLPQTNASVETHYMDQGLLNSSLKESSNQGSNDTLSKQQRYNFSSNNSNEFNDSCSTNGNGLEGRCVQSSSLAQPDKHSTLQKPYYPGKYGTTKENEAAPKQDFQGRQMNIENNIEPSTSKMEHRQYETGDDIDYITSGVGNLSLDTDRPIGKAGIGGGGGQSVGCKSKTSSMVSSGRHTESSHLAPVHTSSNSSNENKGSNNRSCGFNETML